MEFPRRLLLTVSGKRKLWFATPNVEVALGDLESSLASVGRTRAAYIDSPTAQSLQTFEGTANVVNAGLARIRQLTIDNSTQLALCDRLQANANQRVAISRESVELVKQNHTDAGTQLKMSFEVAKTAFETAVISQQMRRNEDSLLAQRSQLSQLLFTATIGILTISFAFSALMFGLHYRLLDRELRERRSAEEQLRRLSLQLIRVQDEERRRFARELHDGLGQILVGAKMMADTLGSEGDPQVAGLSAVLDDAISQTRTLSYLFHPPLLDEAGFSCAAKWLVDGYAQRMGVDVSADFPSSGERLPHSVEITLYRVLQEALTNILRHSNSRKADVSLQTGTKRTTLRVRDYGRGIPSDTLAAFRANATQVGVGLTGMKERVKEQGGQLEIRSDGTGTEVIATIPLNANGESVDATPTESILNTL